MTPARRSSGSSTPPTRRRAVAVGINIHPFGCGRIMPRTHRRHRRPTAPPRPPGPDQGRLAPARRGPRRQGGDPAGYLTPPAGRTRGHQPGILVAASPGENKATQPDFLMTVDTVTLKCQRHARRVPVGWANRGHSRRRDVPRRAFSCKDTARGAWVRSLLSSRSDRRDPGRKATLIGLSGYWIPRPIADYVGFGAKSPPRCTKRAGEPAGDDEKIRQRVRMGREERQRTGGEMVEATPENGHQ